MTAQDLRVAYQNFFLKSEAGGHFMNEAVRLLVDCHEKAENEPELARDYVQRAKGVRLIKQHIDSVMAEGGKPKG